MNRPSQHQVLSPPAEIKPRIERAQREGRFQQALELTKQLCKLEATPEHKQLLLSVYLGRARQLRGQGATRDAANVLGVALQLGDGMPEWLQEVAQELSACGEMGLAMAVLKQLGASSELEGKLLGQAVDRAFQDPKTEVPPQWRSDFNAVTQAFALVEAGQDEQAREALQAIGLRSPVLEWKLLLRGLIAFYQRDDLRALENWQRLNADRVPARLAAPYRLVIDERFRLAQTPQSQMALQKIADHLLEQGLLPQLRSLQKALAREGNYRTALRQVELLLPVLQESQPALVSRLASCFYWELVTQGEPDDVIRYQRVFGAPRDDPRFCRVRALVMEKFGESQQAHGAWQAYEESIATDGANWPGEQGTHARALIWLHMAHQAMHAQEPEEDDDFLFGPRRRRRPRPLTPNTEQCLTKSLELAPDLLEAHQALFEYHLENNRLGRARQVAGRLLKRFPNHLEMLVALAELERKRAKHEAAAELLERALRVNPLDRQLRMRLSEAHRAVAGGYAANSQFDRARVAYQACLARCEGRMQAAALCQWAACELRAGDDTRADELIAQARTQAADLAVAFGMLVEVIRWKLPKALKTRFDTEFKTALEAPPTVTNVIALAHTIAANQAKSISYPGQKAHERLALAYVDRSRQLEFAESDLEALCACLLVANASRVLKQFLLLGQSRFSGNPTFKLFEAQVLLKQPARRRNLWKVRQLLEQAQTAARARPQDDKNREVQKLIDEAFETVKGMDPFGGMFGGFNPFRFFGGRSNPFADDDGEDE